MAAARAATPEANILLQLDQIERVLQGVLVIKHDVNQLCGYSNWNEQSSEARNQTRVNKARKLVEILQGVRSNNYYL
jgi:hypothetical protein